MDVPRLGVFEGTLVLLLAVLLAVLVSAPVLMIDAQATEKLRRECIARGGGEFDMTASGAHYCLNAEGAVLH